jgi:preprotein translocase subunit SecB
MAKKKSGPKIARRKEKAAKEDAAIRVFDHLKLVNVRLIGTEAKLVIRGDKPSRYTVQFTCAVAESTTADHVHANSAVEVEGVPPEGSDSQSNALVKAEYQCVFLVEGIERSKLREHGTEIASVSAMMAWPYLRELIHSTTAKMGLSPFALPTLQRTADGLVISMPPEKAVD